jgi:ABC-type phosphate/phosphonate transport system substrate-binding protein
MLLGAVAYEPKVVTIWEGLRSYFRDDAELDLEVVLFLSYEAQVDALLAGKIDVGWNTNLAFVQCERYSEGACRPIAMRDTDVDWRSVVFTRAGGDVQSLDDLKGKKLALGSKDSGHAAILPVHFLAEAGLRENEAYQSLRYDTDVGKHGDTGTSEIDVLKAVLDGTADAGAVGSPFWEGIQDKGIAPAGALEVVWTSPSFHHCMFTARKGLDDPSIAAFSKALFAMSFDNPKHRPILELEGLREWVRPQLAGYASLRQACEEQGLFRK